MIKKLNAVLTLLLFCFTVDHVISMSLKLFKINPDITPGIFGIVLVGFFFIHAFVSMFILFFNKSDSGKVYKKLNFSTVEQRFTAILMIPLIIFHQIKYFTGANNFVFLIFDILFVFCFTGHIMSSVEKALLSLGIYKKWLIIILRALGFITFIISIIANIYGFTVK